ncbi:MAG: DUF2520 domain-containing protein [Bacillota bacterium]|nr:DUF2520 domain-containing protein [Bacillota bacterium]
MNIGFIGAGKVGCTLGKYFMQDPETNIAGYYSKSGNSAVDAARFTDSKSYLDMKELIDASDMIFLTVPDGSIRDTWKKIKGYDIREKMICHCSGSMSCDDAFDGIEETGAFGYSAHPLFAVSDKYNAYRELTGVFFTLEEARTKSDDAKGVAAAGPGLAVLQGLLDRLGNPTGIIDGKDKTTYHCAAAMASNLVCGLIDQSIELMKRCGFTDETAVQALSPILTGNMEHIAHKGPTASLTGPVERNDIDTVRKHIDCLKEGGEKELYRLLSSRLIHMAQTRHPDRDYAEMRKIIDDETAGSHSL